MDEYNPQRGSQQREILFFDELGFGWVLPRYVLDNIQACSARKDPIVEKTLTDLLERSG